FSLAVQLISVWLTYPRVIYHTIRVSKDGFSCWSFPSNAFFLLALKIFSWFYMFCGLIIMWQAFPSLDFLNISDSLFHLLDPFLHLFISSNFLSFRCRTTSFFWCCLVVLYVVYIYFCTGICPWLQWFTISQLLGSEFQSPQFLSDDLVCPGDRAQLGKGLSAGKSLSSDPWFLTYGSNINFNVLNLNTLWFLTILQRNCIDFYTLAFIHSKFLILPPQEQINGEIACASISLLHQSCFFLYINHFSYLLLCFDKYSTHFNVHYDALSVFLKKSFLNLRFVVINPYSSQWYFIQNISNGYSMLYYLDHADGSIKFWDASAMTLQMLYKLKTSKVFEKQKVGDGKQTCEIVEEDPFAVQMIYWCPESRIFCVSGVSAYVIIYKFSRHEITTEIVSLEVRLQCDVEDIITPEPETSPPFPDLSSQLPSSRSLSGSTNTVSSEGVTKDSIPCLSVKTRPVRMPPGYQADLVIQLVWVDGEPPQQITSLAISSAYGIVAFGNCTGLVVVDFIQKTVLLSMGTIDLYRSSDLYQRQPRSPRKNKQFIAGLTELNDSPVPLELERCKSPTSDHVNGHCTSPTSQSCSSGKRLSSADVSKVNRWGPGRPPFRKAQSAACMEISLPVTTEEARENSYNRSRSSSISSIDKDSKEAVTALYFMESFARKHDSTVSPCLFVGTSLGMVLLISLNLPSSDEQRFTEPVMVLPSGTFLSLKGAVLTFSCMDRTGSLMQPPYEVWRDPNNIEENEKMVKRKLVMNYSTSSQETGDHQYTIICSEKQAKVFSLPSQTCLYVHNITETSFILQAEVVVMCNSACLACFCANGHIMIMSLPSLRPMLDVNYLPLTDMRIARTFCFTNEGQALYLVSPTEIQRLTYSQEMCDNIQDMLGDLFTPIETPEAQNRGFLKGLFGGSGQTFDREELFGEATAGKASRSLAQHIPGPGSIEGMKGAAGGVMGELTRARIALDERGQRLSELEEKTAGMMTSAEAFSKHAHELMLKYKDKKWYQF
ncbi:syntaxin-binding protein 5-like isoform X2, partial [Sigmodon hispidus]